MKTHTIVRIGALLASASIATTAGLLSPALSTASLSTGTWSAIVPESGAYTVMVGPDNAALSGRCLSYDQEVYVYDDEGSLNYTLEQPRQDTSTDFNCALGWSNWRADQASMAVNDDGRYVAVSGPLQSSSTYSLQVFGVDGLFDSEYLVEDECSQPAPITGRPIVDNNMAVYVYRSCQPSGWMDEYNLQAMDIDTGQVIFTTPLGGVENTAAPYWYEGGIALRLNGQIRFFSMSGVENTAATISVSINSQITVNPEGDAIYFAADEVDPSLCTINFDPIVGSVVQKPIDCSVSYGWVSSSLPDGGVAIAGGLDSTPYLYYVYKDSRPTVITSLDRKPSFAKDAPAYRITHLQADINGNVVIASTYAEDITSSAGDSWVGSRVTLGIYDSSGNFQKEWNSTVLGYERGHVLMDEFSMSLANGAIYFTTPASEGTELVKVHTPLVSMNYRDAVRWDLDGVGSSSVEKYVALGDSFSSGEGHPPFLPGTENGCRRSAHAYPYGVSEDLSSTIELEAFVACAGATTGDMIAGKHGEPSQLSAITEDTDIVTLTIGGNDIGFGAFAQDCILGSCSVGSGPYNTAKAVIDGSLSTSLRTAYDGVLSEMSETAHLYVLEYPQVAPVKSEYDMPILQCRYLYNDYSVEVFGQNLHPWGNARGAYDITGQLNAKIATVVAEIQTLGEDRIHFVPVNQPGSVFENRDVCSSDSFFENVDIPNVNATFHPNAKGHMALANILKGHM